MRAVRAFIFGLFCALGGLAGLAVAFHSPPQVSTDDSVFEQLGTLWKPVLAQFGVGMAVGAALGLLVCFGLLKPRKHPA
jgi:hypothetical protein